jgi:AraC-like DNA-binding protein
MHDTVLHDRVTPSAATASVVSALFAQAYELDGQRVAIPRPEIHLIARFGPSAQNGLDVHVLGPRETVHRKPIRGGQWALMARLQLGAPRAVFGLPASRIATGPTPLEDFWGSAATARLTDRLSAAKTHREAAAVLDGAINERLLDGDRRNGNERLVLQAADRLTRATVTVASDLGVSERHLRRVFREAVGVSPKTFAMLARFRRALGAANEHHNASWASIAATAGYYDQAHLIAEFRAIAGVTPRALLRELAP